MVKEMAWFQTFDSAFWLTIAGIIAGMVGVLVNACIKSKCSSVDCFGIKCVRDTQAEVEIEEHGVRPPPPE
jgi:hypothetical protein